jgi:hypothetical protein
VSDRIAKQDQLPPQQAAIADANVGTLTLLTEAITAIGTLQAKVNAILAALRAAGIIAP